MIVQSNPTQASSAPPPASEPSPWISLRKVGLARGQRWIFDGIDLDVQRGSVTAIMGPSGSGKTTLLRLISGQLAPNRGQVLLDGRDSARFSRADWQALRRRMGVLFQSGALFTDLDVFDNVAFPLRAHTRLPPRMIADLVAMKLEAVGLRGARQLRPAELSGGMARRVALARAIVLDPELILYDEPFAGQDPISMGILARLIRQINDALGLTSVIVSHDVAETATIADQMYVIAGGQVIGAGPPRELLESKQALLSQFLHGLPDGPVPFHFPAPALADDLLGADRALGLGSGSGSR